MNLTEMLRDKLGDRITDIREHNDRRLYITVDKENISECIRISFVELNARYIIASAIHNFTNFEVLYHMGFDKWGAVVSFRVYLDAEKPEIVSLTSVIPGISYIEREMWELLGINFTGHPDLKHFLLRDDWPEGRYPLRKPSKQEIKESKEKAEDEKNG